MKITNVALWTALAAFGAVSAGCGEPPKQPAPAANNTNAAAPGGAAPRADPTIVKDEAGPDNSRLIVRRLENGDQVSVRKWTSGPITKVSRREKGGQATFIRVVYKSGKIVRVEDKDAVAHAMDWTAAQLDDVAKKSGKVLDDAPARDRDKDDDEK